MAALATLWPFEFGHSAGQWTAESTLEDVLLNLGLLFPAGFLWRISRPGRRLTASLDALALGALLSALLESVQLYLPARCASPTDVFMNATGAWAGAGLHDLLRRRYADAWLVRVCLTLPLTKLLYLSAPLIALQAWGADGLLGSFALVPLAAFSARIAAALQRRARSAGLGARAAKVREREAWAFAIGFASVFGLISAPIWLHVPKLAAWIAIASVVCARAAFALESGASTGERRFEVSSVLRAAPGFAVYLALVALQQFASVPGDAGAARGLFLLRDVAAFSVLGYMLSQLHGRGMFGARSVYQVSCTVAMVLALAFAALRQWSGARDLAEMGLLIASALIGSCIHRAEVDVVRVLRMGGKIHERGLTAQQAIFSERLERTSNV